jgi:lysophospholipase L1-like esterase
MNSWNNTARLEPPRVDGFGACMISGYPHLPEESFFSCFRELLEADLKAPVPHSTLSLGGFPISRVAKQLKKAIIGHPDFLLVQFGSTDITVSLKYSLLSRLGNQFHFSVKRPDSRSRSKSKSKAPTHMEPFRSSLARQSFELLKSGICRILSVEPIHGGASVYRESMEEICSGAYSGGAVPILLAPFPHGDRVSDSWARRYRDILEEIARIHHCIFVDTYRGLCDIPKEDLLLEDKLHLSLFGHRLVGKLIHEAAAERILQSMGHRKHKAGTAAIAA